MSNTKEPADKQLEDFKKSVEVINYYITLKYDIILYTNIYYLIVYLYYISELYLVP